MDIIDILLARSMSSSSSSSQSAAAAQQAAQAAQEAVDNIQSMADEIQANNELAQQTIQELNDTINNIDEVIEDKVTSIINNYNFQPTEVNLGAENAGHLVAIANDGSLKSSDLTENVIAQTLTKVDTYEVENALGLIIDYENKAFDRTQEAIGKNQGASFDSYSMYGGRMRCNVADDGSITAFYGDDNYKDDGSNGQVMIYQPKFYYQRVPMKTENGIHGKIIRKESIVISDEAHSGFKLHPLFKASDGSELNYVLLPAYEGSAYDVSAHTYILNDGPDIDFAADKLSSIAGAKPISGARHTFTIEGAEKLAKNRGAGWHITNMAAESANQILEMVEFGMLNGQTALELGVGGLNATTSTVNGSATTGSTAYLGNTTGVAEQTTAVVSGYSTTYDVAGKRAISYRGMENPWNNIWRFIGGVIIAGGGSDGGGVPYICKDFEYTPGHLGENYESVGFTLPASQTWTSAMGYGSSAYDWVFMPAECSDTATSASPIGDMIWTVSNLSGNRIATIGGMWTSGSNGGPFYYGCDRTASDASYNSYSARLMFIPTKNAIYNANYNAWLSKFGG